MVIWPFSIPQASLDIVITIAVGMVFLGSLSKNFLIAFTLLSFSGRWMPLSFSGVRVGIVLHEMTSFTGASKRQNCGEFSSVRCEKIMQL